MLSRTHHWGLGIAVRYHIKSPLPCPIVDPVNFRIVRALFIIRHQGPRLIEHPLI